MIEFLSDVIGTNADGAVCHPFKMRRGQFKGLYVFSLTDNCGFSGASEKVLRAMIERGEFASGGRVRMVRAGAKFTGGAGALNVRTYAGAIEEQSGHAQFPRCRHQESSQRRSPFGRGISDGKRR